MSKFNHLIETLTARVCFLCEANPSDDTRRAVKTILTAMFNWTQCNDTGAVGFQMQIIHQILLPNDNAINIHTLGEMCLAFRDTLFTHRRNCEEERAERLAALRRKAAPAVSEAVG